MKILLVDDEERSRLHVAEFLRKLGHEVIEKADGKEALDIFTSADFNLILTDNRMPRMSGLELLRQIRKLPEGQEVDMVIFSAYGDMQNTIEAIRAGAYDYLLKPLVIEELVDVIERVAIHQESKSMKKKISKTYTIENEEIIDEPEKPIIEIYQKTKSTNMVVYSEVMKKVFQLARKLHMDRSIPVLIEGETGTGKELVAQHVHYGAGNVEKPFVAINCATIPPATFESELFGYEAGTFSGGLPKGKKGKIDIAEGGTLFLDEISEIPVSLQSKLLRVLQEKEFYRLGGLKPVKTDVRIISASNQNLEEKVAQGHFRQDLFYRLNVGHIFIPPIRHRKEDIIPLATMFMQEFAAQKNKKFKSINKDAAHMLLVYEWPGNVRELRNIMEWVVFMYNDSILKPGHLNILKGNKPNLVLEESIDAVKNGEYSLPGGSLSLTKFSNEIILKALKMHNGNKSDTAKYLGISRSSLYNRLKNM